MLPFIPVLPLIGSVIKKIFDPLKKIFIIIAVYFVVINLFLAFTKSDKSQQPIVTATQQNREEIYKIIDDPKLTRSNEGKLIVLMFRSFVCMSVGEGCTNNPADGEKNFGGSLVGKMSRLIATPYANPPSSGVYWVYAGLQHAGFVPQAYAAEGIGFAAIKPFMTLWKVFRDVSYLLLVIVLIAIGFMIMFRMKLNPQTVISIENALPRIVITMILITFSFAIAGFLIDFMYVVIAISVSILAKADPTLTSIDLQNKYLNPQFGAIWDGMYPKELGIISGIPIFGGFVTLFTLGTSISNLLPSWIDGSLKTLSFFVFFRMVFGVLGKNQTGILDSLSGAFNNVGVLGVTLGQLLEPLTKTALTSILVFIIASLTLLYGSGWLIGILMLFTMLLLLFRIFFLLFTTYLRILFLIIVSPLILLFEAIPGRNTFQSWLKNLIADLLTFPLVISIMVFGRVLVNLTVTNHGIWTPPFIYGIDPMGFSILLGMGIIFMIPDLNKFMRQTLGIKDMPVGLSLGTFFAGVGAGVGGGIGLVGTLSSLKTGLFGFQPSGGGLLNSLPFMNSIKAKFGSAGKPSSP